MVIVDECLDLVVDDFYVVGCDDYWFCVVVEVLLYVWYVWCCVWM